MLEKVENKMKIAFMAAKEAANRGESPVGAAIFLDDRAIAVFGNEIEERKDVTAHAEILAIKEARNKLAGNLTKCDIYVTLEPCPMCSWIIKSCKMKTLYFGAFSANLSKAKSISAIETYGGILEESCSKLMKDFFKKLR